MESKNTYNFNLGDSITRIKAILNDNDTHYATLSSIPNRNMLTYTNGFYVNVAAMFIDIRESSQLTNEHRRPKLAKLYRCYISEIVAILNSFENCKEINIVGDCVSGIFEASAIPQANKVIDAAAAVQSYIHILNYYFKKSDIVQIRVGIGIAYGRALMIKAGYPGSAVNEIVWMGEVVNSASNLCNEANKIIPRNLLPLPTSTLMKTVYSSSVIIDINMYLQLGDRHRSLFVRNYSKKYYGSDLYLPDFVMEFNLKYKLEK